MPKVVDHLNLTKIEQPKPIELTHCLQHDVDDDTSGSLYCSNYRSTLSGLALESIERVGMWPSVTAPTFDIIVVKWHNGNSDLYLGHWNDGVINNKWGEDA